MALDQVGANSDDSATLSDRIAEHVHGHTQVLLLLEALKDAQGTIRAIDTKVGILLAALAIPLPYVVSVVSYTREHGLHFSFGSVCTALALLAYLVAGFVAIRSLTGTANAAAHVKSDQRPPDVFYFNALYRLGWLDAAFNRRTTLSRRSLEEIRSAVPGETAGALSVLVNEMMILAYIRDVKLFRQKVAFELTALAFVLGILALIP